MVKLKSAWLVVGCCYCLLGVAVHAASPLYQVNNQASITLGYLPTQIHNSPAINNSQYMKGHDLSLGASFTKLFHEHLYTQFSLTTMAGNASYGANTFKTNATSIVQDGAGRLGYFFLPRDKLALTPYVTLGYQYWQLDTGGEFERGFIKNGYTEFYQNGYYGLGLLSQVIVHPRAILSADITIGKTINPWFRANPPEVENSQIGKNIIYQSAFLSPQPFYQIGVGVDYAINDTLHANAGVNYAHQQFSAAATSPSKLLQPHLSISQWQYHAGVGFDLDAPSASTTEFSNTTSIDITKANNQASLWYGYVMQNYAETLAGLDYYFDRQTGNIPTINMVINKTFTQLYTQFNLALGGGNTAYKSTTGSNNSSSPPSNSYTRNTLIDLGLRLGYLISPHDKLGLTPYLAAGYHRWLRDLPAVGYNGYLVNGYPETYQFSWYALGLLTQLTPRDHWVVGVDANFGTMENVTNKSWTSFESPRTYQKLLTLKQRFIYNLALSSDYRFANIWHALAEINYEHFNYGRSANSKLPGGAYWYEPNSTTHQVALMVGIGVEIG